MPSELQDFEPLVGRTFHFDTGHELALTRIETGRQSPGFRQPFTLVFSGPPGPGYMREGTRTCRLDDGEPFALYVAPVQTHDPARQDYQAAFN
ncbi:MAG TPA: hypothetical protein VG939_17800 [Caulobacteraceae bacterium]|nr:hypothetical protein [Caulobacteraceae bacterium]